LRTIPETYQVSNQGIPYKTCMISLKLAEIRPNITDDRCA
jgi:hypothetical protein